MTRPRVKLILNHDVVTRRAAWRGRPDRSYSYLRALSKLFVASNVKP
jgi:hypothetical protein